MANRNLKNMPRSLSTLALCYCKKLYEVKLVLNNVYNYLTVNVSKVQKHYNSTSDARHQNIIHTSKPLYLATLLLVY